MKSEKKNKKLFQVSSKRDNFEYAVKSVAWELPENAKNAQGYAPVKLDVQADSLMEERFTILQDYLFNDEGDKVKVYITFPDAAAGSLGRKEATRMFFRCRYVHEIVIFLLCLRDTWDNLGRTARHWKSASNSKLST